MIYYDNEETRRDEERLSEHLQKIRQMPPGTLEEVQALIDKAQGPLQQLLNKPFKTPEEQQALVEINITIKDLMQRIGDAQRALQEDMARKAEAFYHHVKQRAEQGDEEARKAYEDLKESYEASLKERAGFNDLN